MRPEALLDGRLKLRHLVLVTAIAEHGSLVHTAEHLHVTQPVLTRGLRELEGILGVTLFDRGPRGVTPTVFGEAFCDHARTVLAELRNAERHVTELADARTGTVTVGTHLTGTNLLLPKALATLKAERPAVTAIVREATPDLLLAELLSGQIDLTLGRIPPGHDGPRVQRRVLYRERITLVTRAGHPAQELAEPNLGDLLGYPWILPVAQTALRGEVERVFWRQGLDVPTDRIECTSFLTIRTLLLETDSVATLPYLVARSDEGIAPLNTPLEPVGHTVGVTLPAGRAPTPAVRALLDHLDAAAVRLRETTETD